MRGGSSGHVFRWTPPEGGLDSESEQVPPVPLPVPAPRELLLETELDLVPQVPPVPLPLPAPREVLLETELDLVPQLAPQACAAMRIQAAYRKARARRQLDGLPAPLVAELGEFVVADGAHALAAGRLQRWWRRLLPRRARAVAPHGNLGSRSWHLDAGEATRRIQRCWRAAKVRRTQHQAGAREAAARSPQPRGRSQTWGCCGVAHGRQLGGEDDEEEPNEPEGQRRRQRSEPCRQPRTQQLVPLQLYLQQQQLQQQRQPEVQLWAEKGEGSMDGEQEEEGSLASPRLEAPEEEEAREERREAHRGRRRRPRRRQEEEGPCVEEGPSEEEPPSEEPLHEGQPLGQQPSTRWRLQSVTEPRGQPTQRRSASSPMMARPHIRLRVLELQQQLQLQLQQLPPRKLTVSRTGPEGRPALRLGCCRPRGGLAEIRGLAAAATAAATAEERPPEVRAVASARSPRESVAGGGSRRLRGPPVSARGAGLGGNSLTLGAQPNGPVASLDTQVLIAELLGRRSISATPRAPPWPNEQPGKSDLEAVSGWLVSALPAVEVRAVYRVECALSVGAAYAGVRKALGPERLLWHGTPWDAVANIAQHGFNRAYCGRHGAKLGRGSYFAEDAAYAARFCSRSQPSRAIFLAGVLPGRVCRGEDGLVEPPADATGARFDSTVDDVERPRVFCVFRDFQALPLYLAEVV